MTETVERVYNCILGVISTKVDNYTTEKKITS